MSQKTISADAQEEQIRIIKKNFEINTLQNIKTRQKKAQDELAQIRQLLASDGSSVNNQQTKFKQFQIEYDNLQAKESEKKSELENLNKITEQLLKNIEESQSAKQTKQMDIYSRTNADANTRTITHLKLMMEAVNQQLTKSINYYRIIKTFLGDLIKSELLLHKIVYEGCKTSGCKAVMLKRFNQRNVIDNI